MTALVSVLPKVVEPVGAAVEVDVGADATATVTVFEAVTSERFPAASTTYSLYSPSTRPSVGISVSAFTVEIATWLKLLSAIAGDAGMPETFMSDLTRYAVPASLDLTVTPLAVVTLDVATVGVGAVASST